MNIFNRLKLYCSKTPETEMLTTRRYFVSINGKPLCAARTKSVITKKHYVEFVVDGFPAGPDAYQFFIDVLSNKIKAISGTVEIDVLGVIGEVIEQYILTGVKIKGFDIVGNIMFSSYVGPRGDVPVIKLKLKFDKKIVN